MGLLIAILLAVDPIERAREQLEKFDEKGAIRTLEQARASPDLTPEQLAKLQLYLGLAHAQLADERSAVAAFKHAVLLDPELQLPEKASPTVERWWLKAGGRARPAPPGEPVTPATLTPSPTAEPGPLTAVGPVTEPSAWRPWAGASVLVVGGLGIIGGAFVGVQARGLYGRSRDETNVGLATQLYSQAQTTALLANVLYVVGGLLAAVGLLVLVWPSSDT